MDKFAETAPGDSGTLAPIPPNVRDGLIAVSVLGFVSFFASTGLFLFLTVQMLLRWRTKEKATSQFNLLVYNLLFADIQQSIAFLLNSRWVVQNSIEIGNSTCWAQGWFISTGDLASGVWCILIALHTFGMVLFRYRPSKVTFGAVIFCAWAFIYLTAAITVWAKPNVFVRAGPWCWVDQRFARIRFWLHYFWIFLFEFGTIFIYILLFVMVYKRTQKPYFRPKNWLERKMLFSSSYGPEQAREALGIMVIYPTIYVVCTIPLASARVASMLGNEPHLIHYCVAGAMITSNGWLDVLVYALTRRMSLLQEDGPPREDYGLESFRLPTIWANKDYGHYYPHSSNQQEPEKSNCRSRARRERGKSHSQPPPAHGASATLQVSSQPVSRWKRGLFLRPPPAANFVLAQSSPIETNQSAATTPTTLGHPPSVKTCISDTTPSEKEAGLTPTRHSFSGVSQLKKIVSSTSTVLERQSSFDSHAHVEARSASDTEEASQPPFVPDTNQRSGRRLSRTRANGRHPLIDGP